MAAIDVNAGADRVTNELMQLVADEGLDGLLSKVVLACQIAERLALDAGDREAARQWKGRALNARAYRSMARRVEGRES